MSDTVTRLGVVLFPGFALLDVAGPMQFFHQLSATRPFELSIIARTMDPVSTIPPKHIVPDNKYQCVGESWCPTNTFDDAPNLDILLVPGGLGLRDKTVFDETSLFVKKRYPTLKYLLTVCTGSILTAAAGVLDGRKATSNKCAWSLTAAYPTVDWISKARWVVDGNIWSSSGVAAGMDMTYAFIATVFSSDVAKTLANVMEYEPHTDSKWDPFSTVWNASSQ